jgi:hypothetical protein
MKKVSGVAGADLATVNGIFLQGAAYVFVKPASGWVSETETAKLIASDSGQDSLGMSVAVSGNTVVAGAPGASVSGHTGQGAAYVFVVPDMTTTNVSCSPSTVAVGQPTTCAATVTDTGGGGQTTPTGTVSFGSSGPGAFSDSASCRLSETSPGVASCSVTYTPGASGTPTRSDTITATYSGDPTHKTSNGTTTVTVQPTSKDDCEQRGWQNYGFPNQGQCIKLVNQLA